MLAILRLIFKALHRIEKHMSTQADVNALADRINTVEGNVLAAIAAAGSGPASLDLSPIATAVSSLESVVPAPVVVGAPAPATTSPAAGTGTGDGSTDTGPAAGSSPVLM